MKNFSRALVWLTASEVIFNIASYIVHASVGRILGPADYGRYGLVISLTTMIIVLVGNGLPTAMSKYLSEVFEKAPWKVPIIKRTSAKLQTLIMGSLTAIFFFASPLIAKLLGDPSLAPLFALSSLIIPTFAAASFYLHYFNGLHYFRFQATLKIIRSFARLLFIVGLALLFGLPGSVSGYILSPLSVFFVGLVADWIITKKSFSQKPEQGFTFPGKLLLQYAWPFTLFLISYELVLTLDLYLVQALLRDDIATGLYNAAITVGRIPYYLFYALAVMMIPAIAKSSIDGGPEKIRELVEKSLRLMALLLFPFVTLLAVYAEPILHLFYGNWYLGAANAMSVFAVGAGLLTVFYVLAFALNGAGLVKIPMKLSGAGVLFALVLNLILIPPFGIVGAASATTIVSFFLMLAILVYTERHFSVRLSTKLLVVSLFSAIGIALLADILPSGPLSFMFSGTILFALYYLPLFLTKELKKSDLRPIWTLFTKKKSQA
jgi:stage V sporulation protein B